MTDRKEEPGVPGVGACINRYTFPQPSGMARRFPNPAAWPDASPAQWHGQTFPQPSGMARRFPSLAAWPDVSPAQWHGQTFPQPSGMARRFPHFPSSCRLSGAIRRPHTMSHFPTPSSKLCYNWLRHSRGILIISEQLSTDAVGAPGKVWVLRLWKQQNVQARASTPGNKLVISQFQPTFRFYL